MVQTLPGTSLIDLNTPCLLLDRDKLDANIARMKAHLAPFNVVLRPHLKTVKSIDVARRVMSSAQGPATVSTLAEAEAFAKWGVRDILYAVGLTPAKIERVTALRRSGVDLTVIIDGLEAAKAIASASRASGDAIPVLIEIDCDGHRAGVAAGAFDELVAIGRVLEDGARLRGVMTHAGSSYNGGSLAEIEAIAEIERKGAVDGAEALRAAGLPCPVVSVGSTPTALFGQNYDGVTEVRAGVFMFFDLVMAGINVCTVDDIALSVLATVISRQDSKGRITVDSGWTALSRDRGTADQKVDQGYGLVCDLQGVPYPDLIVQATNQEHGVLELRTNANAALPPLKIGDRVRILPNHACATGSQHAEYAVIRTGGTAVSEVWPRFSGW
ncbi:MAG: alanine racemase [Asticcacaulis sp.]|uniref:alanine racemase n=1 Tax=Asticcacaulis sp. TaxID=1872648 RepID=UPI0039E3F299